MRGDCERRASAVGSCRGCIRAGYLIGIPFDHGPKGKARHGSHRQCFQHGGNAESERADVVSILIPLYRRGWGNNWWETETKRLDAHLVTRRRGRAQRAARASGAVLQPESLRATCASEQSRADPNAHGPVNSFRSIVRGPRVTLRRQSLG